MNPYTYQRPKITPLPNETGLTVPGGTRVAVVPNGTPPALKQPYLPGQYTEYPAAVQGWAQQALPGWGSGIESGSNTTATERRNSPGVVEGNGRNTSKMMYGTDKNAGVIPKEIADKLREKQYNNFDEFRNDFWKAVAETDYANEFLINGDPKNYYRMKNGGAPLVVSNQAINGSFTYQLHHIIPINQGGSVYSVDNLVVVTPRYHAEILIPEVHGYNGFKQFFR